MVDLSCPNISGHSRGKFDGHSMVTQWSLNGHSRGMLDGPSGKCSDVISICCTHSLFPYLVDQGITIVHYLSAKEIPKVPKTMYGHSQGVSYYRCT